MLAELGLSTMLLGLVCAVYAAVAALWGAGRTLTPGNVALPLSGERAQWVLSARNAALVAFLLLSVSCLTVILALTSGEYQLAYVYNTSMRSADLFFKVTALWGGQQGSLLFWSWLMSAFAAAAVLINWRSHRRLMPFVIAVTMLTLAFFLSLTTFFANPFDRFWADPETGKIQATALQPANTLAVAPYLMPNDTLSFWFEPPHPGAQTDGLGLNPLLRHFGMVIHPPMLYLGFVSLVIPFAFAIASLAVRETGPAWIAATRRWALIAWLFLSMGLLLGGRWAYDVLGWGGYWGWDPVENAALLPWLTSTAFLHSIMIQEKRGMLKRWNMILIILTYWLVIFGTFATRSGVVQSVHSFAESPIGAPMLAFVSIVVVGSLILLASRWRGLKAEARVQGWLSRESVFMLNNLVFVSIAVAVFWGSFGVPIISELFLDKKVTMGPPFFELVAGPLFGALFILMGIAPLAAWRSSSAERLGRAMRTPVALTLALVAALLVIGGDFAALPLFLILTVVFAALVTGVYLLVQRDPEKRDLPTVALINVLIGALAALALLTFVPSLDANALVAGSTLAYGFISFAGFSTLWEYIKGVRARMRTRGENALYALARLFRIHQRRYGGYFIHLGIVVLGIGIIGSTLFQTETQRTLAQGEELSIANYTIRYDEPGLDSGRDVMIMKANVTVFESGREVARLSPMRETFVRPGGNQTMTPPAVYSPLSGDVYVLLADMTQMGATVTLKVYLNPLVGLVWFGGIMLIIGTALAAWPHPEPAPAERRAEVPARGTAAKA